MRRIHQAVLRFTRHRRAGATLVIALQLALMGTVPIMGGAYGGVPDLRQNFIRGLSIPPQVATSTVTGSAIDLAEADGPCFAELLVGTVSGTSPTLDAKVTECDTSGGTYADVALGSMSAFTQVVATTSHQVINFKRSKRFVKVVATIAGTTPSFAVAASVFGLKKAS